MKNLNDAINFLNTIQDLSDNDKYLACYDEFFESNKYDEEIIAFFNEDNKISNLLLGDIYCFGFLNQKRDFEIALYCYSEVIKEDNRFGIAYWHLGLLYEKSKEDNIKALENYKIASDLGISQCSYYLGIIYTIEDDYFNQKKDYIEAEKYLLKAIEQDNKFGGAYKSLARLYEAKDNPNKDYEKSLQCYQKSSSLGVAIASNHLGIIFSDGLLNQKVDYQKAEKYYLKAIKQDTEYSSAYYNLGDLYESSDNPNIDYEKAIKYYKKASKLNDAEATNYLGEIYKLGLLNQKVDYKKAEDYYLKAIEQDYDNFDYYCNLYELYEMKDNLEQDYSKALNLFQKLSDLGSAEASNQIGLVYAHGLLNQAINYNKAEKYFLKTKEQDKNKAIVYFDLASLYENEENPNHDCSKALSYYIKGSELGDSESSNSLGMIYQNGLLNQNVDYPKAKKYYLKAIKQDEYKGSAYLNLGFLYGDENYPNKDYLKGIEYFQKASDLFDSESSYFLGRIYNTGLFNQEIDYQKAEDYYLKAIEQDNDLDDAYYYLAILYRNGNNPNKDYSKSLYYYKEASNHGSAKASIFLGRIYKNGLFSQEIDYQKAEEYYLKGIEQGTELDSSYLNLALFYKDEGNHDFYSLDNYKKYLLKAFEKDSSYASKELGFNYLYGKYGFNLDYKESEFYLDNALRINQLKDSKIENYYPIYYYLGILYSIKDNNSFYDENKALEYFYKASECGYQCINEINLLRKDCQNILLEKLEEYNEHHSDNIMADCQKMLASYMPKNHYKLDHKIYHFIITGIINYIALANTKEPGLDFCTVIIPIFKSIENEMRLFFAYYFYLFLKKNNINHLYGNYKNIYDKIENHEDYNFPMGNLQNYLFYYDMQNSSKTVLSSDRLINKYSSRNKSNQLNQLRINVIEKNPIDDSIDNELFNEKKVLNKDIKPYLNYIFDIDRINNKYKSLENYLLSLSSTVEYLTAKYRNPGSHDTVINKRDAEDFCNYTLFNNNIFCELLDNVNIKHLEELKEFEKTLI